MQRMLRPLDLVVCLKFATLKAHQSFETTASDLGVSTSSVFRSIERATNARLVDPERQPRRKALLEFIVHGVPYVFYTSPGPLTRGVPTAHSAPPLVSAIASSDDPYVWPDPEGSTRGQAIEPLSPNVPAAARRDGSLYELLALVDAIRVGRARERGLAVEALRLRLGEGN